MMDRYIMSVAAAVLLSGCSMLSIEPKTSASAERVDMSSYFDQRLAEGRRHLGANRPTLAIEAFRQASYDVRVSAEALNGMAVAYTKLGRNDVAERLFQRAIEADPLDPRFSRNLARLKTRQDLPGEQRTELAKASVPVASEPVPEEQPVSRPARAGAVITAGGKLKPFRGEFLIRGGAKIAEQIIRTRPAGFSSTEAAKPDVDSVSRSDAERFDQSESIIQPAVKHSIITTGVQVSGRALDSIGIISKRPIRIQTTSRPQGNPLRDDKRYHVRVPLNQQSDAAPSGRIKVTKRGVKRGTITTTSRTKRQPYAVRVKLSRPK